ncbi:MAG: proton-conducting transporter membrane subunit [Eubacteriaceae bacterium]|nr:proton-conducting transporter membrane subunit [Eubacteriaceae bacterium]
MSTIIFLIIFPIIIGLALLILKTDAARDIIVKISAAVIAAVSIFLVVQNFGDGGQYFKVAHAETIGQCMMYIEIALAIMIIVLGIMHKRYLAPVFAIIQTPLMVWFELTKGHGIDVSYNMYIDRLSMIMVLIIGIIGTLIAVYALGYMKDDKKHRKDGEPDRRPWFFCVMFIFLGAMNGLVMSNNLIWLYFFWEITSLASFFLIGYNGLCHKKKNEDKIATRNAFRALVMNLAGGLGFVIAIIILGTSYGTVELSTMLTIGAMGYSVVAPAVFLVFAGITKAAQMPFDSWLLGAMVAPTPTSALLHSSTMVKAGVFLIIKLAPVLGWNVAGVMAMMVGGITFLMASFAAISQTNAKRVLAYSTIANLGLIVACGGVGSAGAVWAGIMLIVFHAVTKALLFLCVGTAEHQIGSRNIEDMDGLFERLPRLARCMLVGIAGMFLAPFGMLIAKWATMVSFIDSKNIILVVIICFGSAATAFYWTKWMGKLSATMAGQENIQNKIHGEETFVHMVLTILTVVICLGFPIMSAYMIVPYLSVSFGTVNALALTSNNMTILCIMVAVLVLLFAFGFGKTKKRIVPIYMSGVNKGDDLTFENAMKQDQAVSLRNWYMDGYFNENRMNVIGVIVTSVVIVVSWGLVVASLLGGM